MSSPVSSAPRNAIYDCDHALTDFRSSIKVIDKQCQTALPKVNNIATRRELGAVHREILEILPILDSAIQALGRPKAPLTYEDLVTNATPGSRPASILNKLTAILQKERDAFISFSNSDLESHLSLALGTVTLLGNSVAVLGSLKDDRLKICRMQRSLQKAHDTFRSEWLPILVRLRATKLSDPNLATHLDAYDYNEALRKAWEDHQFTMDPHFGDNIDTSTIVSDAEIMVQIGKSWMKELIGSDDPDRRSLMKADQAIRDATRAMGHFPITSQELDNVSLRNDAVARWDRAMEKASENNRTKRLRVCVYGFSSHGKSSVINSLVGKVLLQAKAFPVTAWPLIVRHNRAKTSPVLTINREHFQPFLAKLQELQFSRHKIRKPTAVKKSAWRVACEAKGNETKQTPTSRQLEELTEEDREYLEWFEMIKGTAQRKVFAFPDEPIEDLVEMRTMLAAINALMRLCWTLMDEKYFPSLANTKWPMIEVNFRSWEGQTCGSEKCDGQTCDGETCKIDLIDLPGLCENQNKIPTHVMDLMLKHNIDGAVCVIKTEEVTLARLGEHLLHAVDATGDLPLVAYGTHKDKVTVTNDTIKRLRTAAWSTEYVKAERVHVCSTGLWVSAHSSLEVELADADAEDPSRLRKLENVWEELPCTTWLQSLITFEPPVGNETYKTFNVGTLTKRRELMIDGCNHHMFEAHFRQYVVEAAADRRQFKALWKARRLVRMLIASQTDTILQALDLLQGSTPQASYKTIGDAWNARKATWKDELKAKRNPLGQDLLPIYDEALTTVASQIKAEITTKYQNQTEDSPFTILTQEDAFTLLNSIGLRIKSTLAGHQRAYVAQIRKAASQAWDGHLTLLSNFLRGVDAEQPHLKQELVEALTEVALSMEKSLEANIADEIAASGKEVSRKHTLDTLEQRSWVSHQQAQDAITGVKILDIEELSEVDKEMAPLLNNFGYILRPPVSGTANSPPLVDAAAWMLPHQEYPVTVSPSHMIKAVNEKLMTKWLEIMRDESEKSLINTVTKAGEIAASKVDRIIEQRTALSKNYDPKKSRIAVTDILRRLIVARAKCLALRGAIDDLSNRWLDPLYDILPTDMMMAADEEYGMEEDEEEEFPSVDLY